MTEDANGLSREQVEALVRAVKEGCLGPTVAAMLAEARAEGRRDALAAYVGTAAQEGTRRGPRLDECGARQAGMVCQLKRGHDGAHEDYSGISGVPAPRWVEA